MTETSGFKSKDETKPEPNAHSKKKKSCEDKCWNNANITCELGLLGEKDEVAKVETTDGGFKEIHIRRGSGNYDIIQINFDFKDGEYPSYNIIKVAKGRGNIRTTVQE